MVQDLSGGEDFEISAKNSTNASEINFISSKTYQTPKSGCKQTFLKIEETGFPYSEENMKNEIGAKMF